MQDFNADLLFPDLVKKAVVARFDGGDITSDAGFLLLAQADEKVGLSRALDGALGDRRQAGKVRHPLRQLLQARLYGIAAGYPDANDHDTLRQDAALKLACARRPQGDGPLASQPTLSRLENRVGARDLVRMSHALAERVIAHLPAETRRVVLDVDASDDPCHGQQQFEEFNAYYACHCYLPLFLHVTDENGQQWLLSSLLRPGRAAATKGLRGMLTSAVRLLRQRFPKLEIIVRADSAFGNDKVLRLCDALQVDYVLGLPQNPRLQKLSTPVQMDACLKYRWAGEGCREFGEFDYRADSWDKARRVVVKAEITRHELNPRYVVTSLRDNPNEAASPEKFSTEKFSLEKVLSAKVPPEKISSAKVPLEKISSAKVPLEKVSPEKFSPEEVYLFYCKRGEQENRIKEMKLDLSSGRTSCHGFLANQFRLLLHAAASVLLSVVQQAAAGTVWAKAQAGTLRLRLLKVGARVLESCRKVWVHLSSAFPEQATWHHLHRNLSGAAPPTPTARTHRKRLLRHA